MSNGDCRIGDNGTIAACIDPIAGSADPSAGAGVEANPGTLYVRTTGGVTSYWIKTGAADTDWIQLADNAYDGTLTSIGTSALATTLQGAIDSILIPGKVDTFATPGAVDLTATPWVRRIRCALLSPSASIVITHPRLTTTSSVDVELEGSTARQFFQTYANGSVTLTTSSYTALAIIVFIRAF